MMDKPLIPLDDLVALARSKSPFYRDLYGKLGPRPSLRELPILDQQAYWASHARDRQSVLTGPLENGAVMSSGGTTGTPKYSYLGLDEWDRVGFLSVTAFSFAGLTDGERVANLFSAGELYASFVNTLACLKANKARVLQFPLASHASDALVTRVAQEFDITTFAGPPTRLLSLIDHIEHTGAKGIQIKRLLFAGEPFFPGQRAYVDRRWPGVEIRSLGYACVDSGFIALADASCAPDEHKAMEMAGIMEIVDEDTGRPLDTPGQAGNILFTNLARSLMPMIRYPTGDRGRWVDPESAPHRKFLLLGRSEEGARISEENVHVSDVRAILDRFATRLELSAFQMVVTHEDHRDRLTLRLAAKAPPDVRERLRKEILELVLAGKPSLPDFIAHGRLHPLGLEWVRVDELIHNPRTGKLRMVVDQRVMA